MLFHQFWLIEKLKNPGPLKAYGWQILKTTKLTTAARNIFASIGPNAFSRSSAVSLI